MVKPKKILIFSLAYHPFIGGAEVAIKEITDRTDPALIEFHMVTLRLGDNPRNEKIGNINVHRIGYGPTILKKLTAPFLGAICALDLNTKHKFDAYWSVMVNFVTIGSYLANILSLNKSVPIILTLQEGDSEKHLSYKWFGLINTFWKFSLKRSDFVTTISSYLKDRAIHLGYKGMIEVVPNGVDSTNFSKPIGNEEISKAETIIEKESEDKILITASRLVSKNGVDVIIKSLKYLPKNIKFVIAGEGKEEKNLQSLAKKLHVAKRIKFLGHVSHDELPNFFHISDCFVRPSRSEGFGNSFMEAMAARLPVIATPVGGIVDFLFDPEINPNKKPTGLFTNVDDPEFLAKQIMRVFNDDDLREKIVAHAQAQAKTEYDWSIISARMRQMFSKTIEKQ